MRRYIVTTVLSFVALFPAASHAQEVSPYPTVRTLEANGLDASRRGLLEQLFGLPDRDKERAKVKQALCPSTIVKPDAAVAASVKTALAVAESDMTIEVAFAKTGQGHPTEAEEFSVHFEFSTKAVLIRPTLPRFNSDADGVWVPFPFETTRMLWVEGKRGSDLLFLIPEGDDCGVQAVAICPRTFVAPSTLATTGYAPAATRYLVSGKADGLFALGQGQEGRVQASLLTTPGVEMPETWFKTESSSTPSATMKFSTPRSRGDRAPQFIKGAVPILGAMEARLDFGTKDSSLRTVRTRTVVEVSEFNKEAPFKAIVRGASLTVEPGMCYMIARWKEQYL